MSWKLIRTICEWIVMASFIAGIAFSIFNFTLAGFTSITWFIIPGLFLLAIICSEVTQLREHLLR